MVINHNMLAINTTNALGRTGRTQAKSMEKLSSGLRINRAGDDAAGLAISEKMRGQIKGLNQASRNAQDGVSLIQTAEGALNETHAILQRMRELAVQGANDTYVQKDRDAIAKEVGQLRQEIDRIGQQTEFNTQKLLQSGVGVKFQVGANSGQTISIDINAMQSEDLSLGAIEAKFGISVDQVTANTVLGITGHSAITLDDPTLSVAISNINNAIIAVSTERANLGAVQNRLEHTINNVDTASENLQASESRIRDVDMAKEMVQLTKNNILQQAAQSMLAQANQAPQGVLSLLR